MTEGSDSVKDSDPRTEGETTASADVKHDPEGGRFYLEADGGEARLSYRRDGDVLDFVSTFTSPELRGRGLAAEVVRAGFEYAKAEGKKVRPSCPYVDTFLRRNPQYRELSTGS